MAGDATVAIETIGPEADCLAGRLRCLGHRPRRLGLRHRTRSFACATSMQIAGTTNRGEDGADDHPAHQRDADAALRPGARSIREDEREVSEHRGRRGHENRAKPRRGRLDDRLQLADAGPAAIREPTIGIPFATSPTSVIRPTWLQMFRDVNLRNEKKSAPRSRAEPNPPG